eukprot:2391647-Rhodomonas_salina.2
MSPEVTVLPVLVPQHPAPQYQRGTAPYTLRVALRVALRVTLRVTLRVARSRSLSPYGVA